MSLVQGWNILRAPQRPYLPLAVRNCSSVRIIGLLGFAGSGLFVEERLVFVLLGFFSFVVLWAVGFFFFCYEKL